MRQSAICDIFSNLIGCAKALNRVLANMTRKTIKKTIERVLTRKFAYKISISFQRSN